MVSSPRATRQERRATVAEFAAHLFGHDFSPDQVIEETLVTFTDGGASSPGELRSALTAPLPATINEFRTHPLARWAEAEFGVEPEEDGRLKRRVPRTLAEAAARLAEASAVGASACAERLREILNRGGALARDDGGRAFAFKLHQFIGQGRALFATLEAADDREFSLEGQVQTGDGRLFLPIKFCRQCGQDYYHVLRSDRRFLSHPVGVEGDLDDRAPGYLMLAPTENDWSEDRIPDEWRDARGRLTPTWRDRVPEALWATPDGNFSSQRREGSVRTWWQRAPFSLCLNCGEFYTAREGIRQAGFDFE